MLDANQPLPAWARLADFLTAGLALVAVTVAASGGFHVSIQGIRVNLTSPYRVLAWAVALTILRHAVRREHPIYGHLVERASAWRRSIALRNALLVTVATRPVVFFVGYLAIFMFGWAPGAQPFNDFSNELFNLPLRFDTGWYLSIATGGYEFSREVGPAGQQNIVFFPAYPMLVRTAALFLGNVRGSYVLGGTAISLVLFVVALAYVYRIARFYLDDDAAMTTLWLIAAYPFAVFFGAIYTESLYLAGAAGAFYHLRQREWARAAAWGFIVGLSRPNGCFLALPLVLAALEEARRAKARLTVPAIATAAAPGVGVLIYSLFIWRLTGNPISWALGHAAWGRHYEGLTHLVTDRYNFIANAGLTTYVSQRPYDMLNTLGVILVLASVWPLGRRFSLAFAVFVLVNIVPPLAAGGLMSAGRFSSVLFPAFLWLASVVPDRHRAGWIAGFASLQAINAALFYTWRPLY
jgi:hypothetical protein